MGGRCQCRVESVVDSEVWGAGSSLRDPRRICGGNPGQLVSREKCFSTSRAIGRMLQGVTCCFGNVCVCLAPRPFAWNDRANRAGIAGLHGLHIFSACFGRWTISTATENLFPQTSRIADWNIGMKKPFFTVFTPTYNRAHTLERVYRSLLNQTDLDFEWIIVDDGSTDGTAEVVANWQAEAVFPIRYIYQENKGKHAASNVGVREANGEMFLFFDSDDACIPEALECFKFHWDSMSREEKKRFSTISALCVNSTGQVISKEFRADIVDAETTWEQIALRSSGDLWGVNRTNILRQFPFPEIPGEKFIPEGIVWNRMAQQYSARFINTKLKLCEYRSDGLSASSIKIRVNNPVGTRLYYMELSKLAIPLSQRVKALINYIRFSFHGHIPAKEAVLQSGYICTSIMLLIPGWLMYKRDKVSQ